MTNFSASPEHLRVLMVHNRYQIRGGEDESFDAERNLLRSGGHEVECYVRDNREIEGRSKLRTAADTVWSRGSRRDVEGILGRGGFDVMHVQNSFPLISPSIFGAARKAGVAVVQTLRNYRPFCVNGFLMREGQICELCLGEDIGWGGVRHGCYRGSRVASAVVTAANAFHRARATWIREVDRFIVASEVTMKKFREGGFPSERLRLKPNVMPALPDLEPGERQRRAIFVGRLSEEKGVRQMVDAWTGLDVPLEIVGSGPLADELAERARAHPNISFRGRVPVEEACRAIAESELLLLPSCWYETFGRTVLEAYAMGTAVLSSRGTAPGELVQEGRTGLLVDGGSVEQIHKAVREFFALPVAARRGMGEAGRELYRGEFGRERNLDRLIEIYREAMSNTEEARRR